VSLPLCLFCQLVAPQQAALYKLTLDTNRPPPQLVDLFQDMVAQAQVRHQTAKQISAPDLDRTDLPQLQITRSSDDGMQMDSLSASTSCLSCISHMLSKIK